MSTPYTGPAGVILTPAQWYVLYVYLCSANAEPLRNIRLLIAPYLALNGYEVYPNGTDASPEG